MTRPSGTLEKDVGGGDVHTPAEAPATDPNTVRSAPKTATRAQRLARGMDARSTQLLVPKGSTAVPSADPVVTTLVVPGKTGEAEGETPSTLPPDDGVDLRAPELYLNRELTWLSFNGRVLAEAQDERNPLLERVKFLAIASSNLDEFFMKRIGGLKQQVATGVHERTIDGRTPQQQIEECTQAVKDLQIRMHNIYLDLVEGLRRKGIVVATYEELSDEQAEQVRGQYRTGILPLVTPLAMDRAHPFPFISNPPSTFW